MKSNYKKLGDYIRLVDNRNTESSITFLRGVSTSKKLIKSVANMTGVSLTNYKIVNNRQFVYVSDTSRRGEKIALAMNYGKPCIVSSVYTVFEVKDEAKLLPEFLLLWVLKPEFNRYARFHSWGSARETFDWDDMCNVELPIPDIEEQKKYVALYKSTLEMQQSHENSIPDLQLICDSFIETLKKTEDLKTLGDYIELTDKRNVDLGIDNLLGVSVNKKFIASRSNKEKLNLKNYKIVKEGQFSYVTVTSRNGEKISIALKIGKPGLVSSTYIVFSVKDTSVLLPEFLFLWFKRTDFDRYARFNSWGSARETFDWNEMCRVQLPIPDIKVQESIVAIHYALKKRRNISEKLKEMIQELCPVLMSGVVKHISKVAV